MYIAQIEKRLIEEGEKLGVVVDSKLVDNAVRQYLAHLKRCRKYREKMRTDPTTKDEWYRKKRENARKYESDPGTKVARTEYRREYRKRPHVKAKRNLRRREKCHNDPVYRERINARRRELRRKKKIKELRSRQAGPPQPTPPKREMNGRLRSMGP